MKLVMLLVLSVFLASCVSGAPRLTSDQMEKLQYVSAYKVDEAPSKKFNVIENISGVDCSGAPGGGRVWGNSENAVEILRKKAVAIGADAVVNVSCGAAPFVNNCWAAQKCNGDAVEWVE